MIIGSHVSMSSPDYVLGSIKEMLSYHANACMIYTGPPQNGRRVPIEKLKIDEAKALLKENHLSMEHVVVHAPYLINLANTLNPQTYENSIELLKNEIIRTDAIGSPYLILHPGSHVNAGSDVGIQSIIQGLNAALDDSQKCILCLETMAGKGTEVGRSFEELARIIEKARFSDYIGVCLDTCHIYDGGYDIVGDLDGVVAEFDRVIGLDRLCAIHLNDSKNPFESHKDRHEVIGGGSLGLETMKKVINHPKLRGLPFYLETPNELEGYKKEIELLKSLYEE